MRPQCFVAAIAAFYATSQYGFKPQRPEKPSNIVGYRVPVYTALQYQLILLAARSRQETDSAEQNGAPAFIRVAMNVAASGSAFTMPHSRVHIRGGIPA
jgi:hypothetical protein